MFTIGATHASQPIASLIAGSESSDGGSSITFIVLVVMAAILVISLIGRSASTVVVVEKPAAGSVLGFALIALALGILYFVYIAPSSGLT